jgi:hypothetical protein
VAIIVALIGAAATITVAIINRPQAPATQSVKTAETPPNAAQSIKTAEQLQTSSAPIQQVKPAETTPSTSPPPNTVEQRQAGSSAPIQPVKPNVTAPPNAHRQDTIEQKPALPTANDETSSRKPAKSDQPNTKEKEVVRKKTGMIAAVRRILADAPESFEIRGIEWNDIQSKVTLSVDKEPSKLLGHLRAPACGATIYLELYEVINGERKSLTIDDRPGSRPRKGDHFESVIPPSSKAICKPRISGTFLSDQQIEYALTTLFFASKESFTGLLVRNPAK